MITLITGIPGMGKTSLCLDMMLKERGKRPLFVMGIPELKVDHLVTPPVAEWAELRPSAEDPSLMLPYFTFPEKSILIIDECQRVFPPRATGSKVPSYVAAFSTHRHTGIDIWLLTQDPGLLDSFIRKQVGRHIHIRPTPMGRKLYEWKQVHDPESKADRDIAARKDYKPPKHVFNLYKSAEAHTKQPFRIPRPLVILALCIAGGSYLAYGAYHAIGDKIAPKEKTKTIATQDAPTARPVGQSVSLPSTEYNDAAFVPRNFNRPESAPVYDEIHKVQQMPQISGCIASASKCICYDQQGSRVPLVQDEYCRQVSEHPEFNPYRPADGQLAQPQPMPQLQASTPATLPAGAI